MAAASSSRRAFGLLASLVVVTTACGSTNHAGIAVSGASAPVPTVSVTNSPAVTQKPPAASQAATLLNFSVGLVGGSQIDTASLLGKPVAFWFWAPG